MTVKADVSDSSNQGYLRSGWPCFRPRQHRFPRRSGRPVATSDHHLQRPFIAPGDALELPGDCGLDCLGAWVSRQSAQVDHGLAR